MDAANGGDATGPAVPADLGLVHVLQAMSDPRRLAMLKILADGEWHPCGAGDWAAGLHKSTISHHIKILREAGLFEAQQRGRTKYGRLRRDAIDERFPGLLNGILPHT
jgi:DNA-binding transcriptional ArsR family regulator